MFNVHSPAKHFSICKFYFFYCTTYENECFVTIVVDLSNLISRPNDSRREVWIKNSGNEKLYGLSPHLRRLFCEDHFDPKYLRSQFNRTILRRDAVPDPFNESSDLYEVGE